MRLIIGLLTLSFFTACLSTEKTPSNDFYFDTKGFFEGEAIRLAKEKFSLKKQMVFNDKQETKTLDTANWKKELAPFIAIDMFKPSYNGRFKKDSMLFDNYYQLTFTSTDKKTDLKTIDIWVDNNSRKVKAIAMLISDNNTIYESGKLLKYYTDSAFSIEGEQHIKLAKGIKYVVAGKLIKP